MGTQNQFWSINQNPLSVSSNQTQPDVRASSAAGGDEHHLKVRKPYTISKQRERWAEEEHRKFLEALQLYGRAWRRVEEHIGTKTAVQIRSHAQKFFSKVVRESAADGNAKSIEIPPPRPKRKPAHPYPRKLGNTFGNGGLSIGKLERSLSQVKSAFEQENGSPTSVLSGVGSDTLGSLLSSLPSGCESPVASAAGSNEQEESVGEENNLQSPGRTGAGLTTHAQSAMELDISSEGQQVPCLKLFGKTVLMTDSHKPSSPSVGNTTQISDPVPTLSIGIQDRSAHIGLEAPPQNSFQCASPGDLSQGLGKSNWSPWSGGMFPMFYPSQSSNFGDISNPADTRIIPLPWWGVYGNLPSFPFTQQQDECSRQVMNQSFAEGSSDKERQKECSGTGSNTASAGEVGNVVSSQSDVKYHKSIDTNDSPLLRSPRDCSEASVRGFLPYKRCLVGKEAQQHPLGVADDGEGPSIGLSL